MVEKTSPDHYLVYDGTITTCELPQPKWQFDAHKVVVDVGGNASIYHSTFMLHGFPVFYFPYATHPVAREARTTGFTIPTVGRSSTNGNEVGDSFYWAINRSMDATIGAQYLSKRGWSQRGEFRARPSDDSYVSLDFFGVIDRGLSQGAGVPPLREGGQEARLTAEGNFAGFRAVSNIDYLSSFLFRLAFNEVFTQAVNSEVKSQMFLSKELQRLFFRRHGGALSELLSDYESEWHAVLSADVRFHSDSAHSQRGRIQRGPAVVAHAFVLVLRRFARRTVSRTEPGFHTAELLGRFDLSPEISLPFQFHGWSLRPALALHETYYTERFVSGLAVERSYQPPGAGDFGGSASPRAGKNI